MSLLEAEVLLKDELLDFMQAGIDELTEKVKELGEKAKYFDDSFGIDCEAGDLFGTRKVRGDEYRAVKLKVKKV